MQTCVLRKQSPTHPCNLHLEHADLCARVSPKDRQNRCKIIAHLGKLRPPGMFANRWDALSHPQSPGEPCLCWLAVGWLVLVKRWHQSPSLAQKVLQDLSLLHANHVSALGSLSTHSALSPALRLYRDSSFSEAQPSHHILGEVITSEMPLLFPLTAPDCNSYHVFRLPVSEIDYNILRDRKRELLISASS